MINFLLGTEASAKSLPIGNALPSALRALSDDLFKIELREDEDNVRRLSLIEDLIWLANNADRHETVDSFAKKVHMHVVNQTEILRYDDLIQSIDKRIDYLRLKRALTSFFVIRQYGNLDKRYNKLLSYIMDKRRPFIYGL